MWCHFEVADQAIVVVGNGIEDPGAVNRVVEDDTISVAEVTLEFKVGEVAVSGKGPVVLESTGTISPNGTLVGGEEV